MDSSNPPMAFPNGYVYSFNVSRKWKQPVEVADGKALKAMAANNFNVVTCPRTRESCSFDRLRKVYIS